jgi:hypothetical protein
MTVVLANNVASTLAEDLTSVAGSITVASGTGARFPTLTSDRYFYATIISTSGFSEIVKVTGRTGDLLTVERGAESTVPFGFAAGSKIELRITAQSVTDAVADGVATVGIAVGPFPPESPVLNQLWVDTN